MDLSAVGSLSATQKDQLMSEVKQQIAVANAQELLTVSIYLSFSQEMCKSPKPNTQYLNWFDMFSPHKNANHKTQLT